MEMRDADAGTIDKVEPIIVTPEASILVLIWAMLMSTAVGFNVLPIMPRAVFTNVAASAIEYGSS
jgi:hypothetical protein